VRLCRFEGRPFLSPSHPGLHSTNRSRHCGRDRLVSCVENDSGCSHSKSSDLSREQPASIGSIEISIVTSGMESYRGVSQRAGPRLPGFGYGTHLGGSRPGCRGAQEINRIDLGRTALSPTVSAMKKAAPTSRPKERRSDTSVRNHLEAWISLRSLGRPRRHRLYPNIEKEPAFRQKLGRSHD
jgi:hypothetical protein